MRLLWEAPDPEAAAERLGSLVGLAPEQVRGRPEIGLGSAVLEFAPTRGPSGDERLRLAGRRERPTARGRLSVVLAGVGWATVDRERAAAELGWELQSAPRDAVLGAAAGVVDEDRRLVLLEPDTEGRIAASLARWGEGPAALYLAVGDLGVEAAREAVVRQGARVSAIAGGPFGRSLAVMVGPAWGPHVVFVERTSAVPPPGTITP